MAANEKALATVPRTLQQVMRHEAPDIFKIGETLARSGYFLDAKDAAQAVVKVLAGRELGIGDIQAMTGIYIVKGKVSLSANLMAALVKRSGRYNYRVVKHDDTCCEIDFYENGEICGRSSFNKEDAKKAGLTSGNWTTFPRNMYFARAMSNGVKWFCPDVSMSPLYTPDELGAQVDGESGEVIVVRTEPEVGQPEPQAPATVHEIKPTVIQPEGEHDPQRKKLKQQVRDACTALGYDLAKKEQAMAKIVSMTNAQIVKALESLNKLIEQKEREALIKNIRAEFAEHGWGTPDDEALYLKRHEIEGPLDKLTLDQLVFVADDLGVGAKAN